MRILFWGTPDFAVPSLLALGEEGHDVVGVVTQPDRPAGRGRTLTPSPVKEVAESQGYPILQPEKPRGEAFLEGIRALEPDLSVVVAYGHILRPEVLEVPLMGSINVHASLLPALRGAAPVNWAIIRGHEVTGITVMRMVEAMDAGPILHQIEEPIGPEETASDLAGHLSQLGAEGLVETLVLLGVGVGEEREQDETEATYAPKIDRETAHLDWEIDAVAASNWIRGMDEVPGAWNLLEDEPVKLFRPLPEPEAEHDAEPGEILEADPKEGLRVAAAGGAVRVREVQPAGKRRMEAAAWIRGRGAQAGQRLE